MSSRSTLILSQRAGKVCVDSSDRMTKWEWKLRHCSFKLKFSAAQRGWCGGLKREKRETISGAIVAAIDRLYLRN